MVKSRISITHLTKACPLYLHFLVKYPLYNNSLEAEWGSYIHRILEVLVHQPNQDLHALLEEHATTDISQAIHEDEVFQAELIRVLENARDYIIHKNIHNSQPQTEMKIEYPITVAGEEITLVGIVDLLYQYDGFTVIADWKTGTYPSEEHHLQLHFYAYILHELGYITEFPIFIRDIYLGADTVQEVNGAVKPRDLPKIRSLLYNTIEQAIKEPKPKPSSSCVFCPYKFRCPTYYRLGKENDLVKALSEIDKFSDYSQQLYKFAKQLKNLSEQYAHASEVLSSQGKYYRKKALSLAKMHAPNKVEEKVWASEVLKNIHILSDEEKCLLLERLLEEGSVVSKDILPPTLHHLFSFESVKK